ncbi:MAG: DUF177 domain-containing protein [Chlorobi bacterium]|nr:DUF177 domain-containing protein [Chlorobiota bacterium]
MNPQPGKERHNSSALLVIPIVGLEEKEYQFAFNSDVKGLGVEDAYSGTVRVSGTISRVGGQYHVHSDVSATQTGECDRCLCKTEQDFKAEFSLYYRVVGESPEEYNHDKDDGVGGIYTLKADEHAITLDKEVVETLQLGIPMKNLCGEDCKGLCSMCGTNLNQEACECDGETIDPRWANLKGLFPDGTSLN